MTSIVFKEWLPDMPDLGNPGLITAKNVLPLDTGYGPFRPLDTSMGTVGASGIAGNFVATGQTKGAMEVYAFGTNDFWVSVSGTGSFTTRGSLPNSPNGIVQFAQFDDLVIAVGASNFPVRHTTGSASNFTLLALSGTAPPASVVGIVNRFVVVGDLQDAATVTSTQNANSIAWSAIDQPTNWPTPNSATAIATQSGEQELFVGYGAVRAIHGGDQFAIILQQNAVTRMTYVGPPVVFQFDVIDTVHGSYFPRGSIQVGKIVYFVSREGFFRTDGVTVEPIGDGKVNEFFWNENSLNSDVLSSAYDPITGLIQFAYAASTAGSQTANRILSLNPDSGSWAYCDTILNELVSPITDQQAIVGGGIMAFNVGNPAILGKFAATAGTAVFETGEFEANEGGRAYLDAVKPHVESSGTAPSMGVRIGTRDSLGTTPSYTATAGPNSRSGFAHFRSDAKYHRVELNITGNFDRATGLEVAVQPSGSV